MEKRRARKPEEKANRKQSIVTALKNLLLQSRYPLPSVNDIAREAGVTKGVIYFYFETREEIFLTLHSQESMRFFEMALEVLQPDLYSLEKVKKKIISYFQENEIFMYLGLLAPGILEANVSVDFAREFKQGAARGMEEMSVSWGKVESEPKPADLRHFILRYYFLALTLWQHHHPPRVIQEAFPDQDLWLFKGNLKKELDQSFDWLWNGMNKRF